MYERDGLLCRHMFVLFDLIQHTISHHDIDIVWWLSYAVYAYSMDDDNHRDPSSEDLSTILELLNLKRNKGPKIEIDMFNNIEINTAIPTEWLIDSDNEVFCLNKDIKITNLSSMKSEFTNEQFDSYRDLISESYFSLCPRGYGPTSFRLYESISLGSVPIYISDDFFLPFKELIDWENLAVLIKPKEIKKIPLVTHDRLTELVKLLKNKESKAIKLGLYYF